jgi:putative transposase
MIADEVTEGLLRLGIVHQKTLPYSPYQNGKQECFWASLEGRLMEMLGGVTELSQEFLNQATQAWVEIEYNRRAHREISCSPVERFAQASDVLRPSPSSSALRDAFRMEGSRTQRQSDGTVSKELPPLLKRLLAEYAATGLPPAYLPKNPPSHPGETP